MAVRGRGNVPFTPMPTCLVTGGAGFLGSHLCDELLRRGHRVICVDNLETGSLAQHRAHPRARVSLRARRHHRAVLHRRARRRRLPRGLARLADRLPAPAAAHAEGRLARHPPHARAGQAPPRALPALLDERGLRRPAGPPAGRGLLGQRQPDRPARRLRRGQALRRGADDGLPPPAGRRHGDRADLQHLRRRGCARTTAARSRPSCARRSPNRPITVFGDGSQTRSLLLRRRPRPRASSRWPSPASTTRSTSATPTSSRCCELAEAVIEVTGVELGDRLRGAAHGRPQGAPARHHARPRRCWAGSPRCRCARACGARSTRPASTCSSAPRGRTLHS